MPEEDSHLSDQIHSQSHWPDHSQRGTKHSTIWERRQSASLEAKQLPGVRTSARRSIPSLTSSTLHCASTVTVRKHVSYCVNRLGTQVTTSLPESGCIVAIRSTAFQIRFTSN